ncbi:MAG: hypothetical protein ACI3XN_08370, partial [Eubacteriales bacterium]
MPITDEELKAIFRANDYTTYVPKYDARTATAEENKVHSRAKALFYKSWCGQLRDMGGKASLKNFSKDYPVKLLEQTDENIIAEQVVEVLNDESKLQSVFEVFFTSMEKPLDEALSAQAASLGKSLEELTDEEIMRVVDKVADVLMNTMIGKMMVSQSVPEILQITKKHGAHEDFNPNVKDNHDRVDFERKWDHLRTKLGKMLSFDELDPDDESLAYWDDEPMDDEAVFVDLTKRFLASLDDEI